MVLKVSIRAVAKPRGPSCSVFCFSTGGEISTISSPNHAFVAVDPRFLILAPSNASAV